MKASADIFYRATQAPKKLGQIFSNKATLEKPANLTAAQRDIIREKTMAGERQCNIARSMGIADSTVHNFVRRHMK